MAKYLEKKELELDGEKYLLTVFSATDGLGFQHRLMNEGQTPSFVKDLVGKGATLSGVQIDAKLFDKHFAGRYGHLNRLVDEIINYNFDDLGPNVESDSDEV